MRGTQLIRKRDSKLPTLYPTPNPGGHPAQVRACFELDARIPAPQIEGAIQHVPGCRWWRSFDWGCRLKRDHCKIEPARAFARAAPTSPTGSAFAPPEVRRSPVVVVTGTQAATSNNSGKSPSAFAWSIARFTSASSNPASSSKLSITKYSGCTMSMR